MKSTATKFKISGKSDLGVVRKNPPSADADDRTGYIATAAYYKAEARGFVPGQELEDWLEAEAQFDAREGC